MDQDWRDEAHHLEAPAEVAERATTGPLSVAAWAHQVGGDARPVAPQTRDALWTAARGVVRECRLIRGSSHVDALGPVQRWHLQQTFNAAMRLRARAKGGGGMSTRYTDRDGRVWEHYGEDPQNPTLTTKAGDRTMYQLWDALEFLVGPLTPVEEPKSADWQAGFAAGVAHQLRHGQPVESWEAMRALPYNALVLDRDGDRYERRFVMRSDFEASAPWRLIYQPEGA